MAEEGFEIVAALVDGVTAPADQMIVALSALTHAISQNSAALQGNGKAHQEHAGHSRIGLGSVEDFTKALLPQMVAAELAADAIKELGHAFVEATKFAVEASESKENAITAFEAIQEAGHDVAAAMFSDVQNMATAIHMPATKATALAQGLMEQGLENESIVIAAVEASGNLARVGMEKGAQKLQTTIERSLASGHLEIGKKGLVGTGVSMDALVASLAGRLHEGTAQIKAELKAGKIGTEVGIAAIVDAINGGKIGEIARKKFDIKDAFTDFETAMTRMFQDVDTGPLTGALQDFVGIFDQGSASGRAMHDSVTSGLNGIVKWLGNAVEEATILGLTIELWALENKHSITEAFESGKVVAGALWEVLKGVAKALEWIAGAAVKAGEGIGWIGDKLGMVDHGATPKLNGVPYRGGPAGAAPPAGTEPPVVAQPHADGGLVVQPPPGEALAAVKPGELILPERFATPMVQPGKGGEGGARGDVHFTWDGDVIVQGDGDTQKIRDTVTSALADVLEIVRLEVGG